MALTARPTLTLHLLSESFAVCQLAADSPVPDWAAGNLVSVTRTPEELSIVCEERSVPVDVKRQGDFRCFRVAGPLDFTMTGVIAALACPLTDAGISLFPLGTYNTDYIFVRRDDLDRATATLRKAGHRFVEVKDA
jgi:hypothetical protein